jgi:hypothetical protein
MFDDAPKPDVRSDVFSLAATVYTLLAGRTPFEVERGSNTALDLMARIERGAITPLNRPDAPASLVAVLRKGMAVERSQRYASAVEFARALQRVELELSYSATPIEVPNLTVSEQQRPTGGDPADETRARAVTTVPAQSPAPQAEETRIRSTTRVAAQEPSAPVAESTVLRTPVPVDEDAPAPPPTRARRARGVLIGILVGAAAVTAVVVAVIWGSTLVAPPASEPTEAAVDDGGPVIVAGVPAPVDGAVAADASGTEFTFTWANPDPQDGDAFVWVRTDGAGDDTRHPTTEPRAVVSDVPAGTNVCIEVSLVRENGEESGEPLGVCVR